MPYTPPRTSDAPPTYKEGLFYRGGLSKDEESLAHAARTGVLTVCSYQEWVEFGWKEPHYNPQSAIRYADKLNEEVDELAVANGAYMALPTDDTQEEMLLEAGDVLWTTTAVASHAGLVVGTCLEQSGVPHRGDRVTFGDIDSFVRGQGGLYIPRTSEEMQESALYLTLIHTVHTTAKMLSLDRGDDPAAVERTYISAGASRCGPLIAQLILGNAGMLQENGFSLAEAAAMNIRKISERREGGNIDRSHRKD